MVHTDRRQRASTGHKIEIESLIFIMQFKFGRKRNNEKNDPNRSFIIVCATQSQETGGRRGIQLYSHLI